MFSLTEKITEFIRQCLRVVRVATKPDSGEFLAAVKVTGLGILIIGIVGFAIYMLFQLMNLGV